MIEKVLLRIEAWLVIWTEVVISPTLFFQRKVESQKLSAIEFYFWMMLLSILLVLITSLIYFIAFHEEIVRVRIQLPLLEDMKYVTKLFVAYGVINFVSILFLIIFSFLIFKMSSTSAKIDVHADSLLYLSALEPLSAFAITFYWLADQRDDSLLVISLIAFLIAKLWFAYSSYIALKSAHKLPTLRFNLIYSLRYIPLLVVFTFVGVGVIWLLISSVIVPWWD